MSITWHSIHPDFRLNGRAYDIIGLEEFASKLIGSDTEYERSIGEFLCEWLNDSETITVKTSGSTGQPKTISLQKDFCINSAKVTGDYFKLKPGNSALLCLPAKYIAGKMMVVRALILGLKLDYVEPNSTPFQNTLKKFDFAAMVPLQVASSLQNLEQLQTLIIGGAAIPKTLRDKLKDCGTTIFETYGMTETVTHIAVKKINEKAFQVLSGVTVYQDNRNCLVIDAPKVSADIVVTNDLVKLINKNQFIWLGRYDNIINSAGVKLIPEQIEAKLSQVFSCRFFVTGIPDETMGEKLILLVEGDFEPKEILNRVRGLDTLDKYEVPKDIYAVQEFSMTHTGKVQRMSTLKKLGI